MLPSPHFCVILCTISLLLTLVGCRSTALAPRFSAVAGYAPPPLVPHLDTTTAVTTHAHSTTPRNQADAAVRPQSMSLRADASREKAERANTLASQRAQTVGDTASSSTPLLAPRERFGPAPRKSWRVQTIVHYSLHFVFPIVLALVFFPALWQTAYLLMVATMLIDLDHLLAKPIFDPLRCSVGYHPLHSFYALPVYVLLLLLPVTQPVAVGLLFHLFTDTVDCVWNFSHCHECYLNSRIYALHNWVRKLLGRETTMR